MKCDCCKKSLLNDDYWYSVEFEDKPAVLICTDCGDGEIEGANIYAVINPDLPEKERDEVIDFILEQFEEPDGMEFDIEINEQ